MQKTYSELCQGFRLLEPVSALVAVALLWTGTAVGQVVVNCPTDDLQAGIESIHPVGGTVLVTGTCVRPVLVPDVLDPFIVSGFTGTLTIDGGGTLMQDVVLCGMNPAPTVLSAVLRIKDSSDVHLRDLTIKGGLGVEVDNSNVIFEGDVVVSESRRNGVTVTGSTSRVLLDDDVTDDWNSMDHNCRHGIFLGGNGSATVSGTTKIEDNGGFGVVGRDGAGLEFAEQPTINNNGWGGVNGRFGTSVLIRGMVEVRQNGMADPSTPNFLFPRFRSGVSVTAGSNLVVFADGVGTPAIFDNVGPGILLDLASVGRLLGMDVFRNTQGFVAQSNPTAEFLAEFGIANTLMNNNKRSLTVAVIETTKGKEGGDLVCDSTSVIVGDVSGAEIINCASAN